MTKDNIQVQIHEESIAIVTLLGQNPNEKFPWGTRIFEHRINPGMVQALNDALDAALSNEKIACVIVQGQGPFFSNGMDLQWIEKNQDKADSLQRDTELLLARLLTFPIPTIAAINGHFCAAGAMLGLAFDIRVMTKKEKKFFVPAVDLGLVYSEGMTQLMKAKTPTLMHLPMIALAHRYSNTELLREGVISKLVDDSDLLKESIVIAETLVQRDRFRGSKYRETLFAIKRSLYKESYLTLTDASNFRGMGFDQGKWDKEGRVSRL